MNDPITLTENASTTTRLPLEGVEPGERGSASVAVTYNGESEVRVAMYAAEEPTGSLAQRLRLSIFEYTESLLPFPVFRGSLAEFGRRTSYADGVGRWTGHGGRTRTVTYEVVWTLPADAEPPDDTPKLALSWEARQVTPAT